MLFLYYKWRSNTHFHGQMFFCIASNWLACSLTHFTLLPGNFSLYWFWRRHKLPMISARVEACPELLLHVLVSSVTMWSQGITCCATSVSIFSWPASSWKYQICWDFLWTHNICNTIGSFYSIAWMVHSIYCYTGPTYGQKNPCKKGDSADQSIPNLIYGFSVPESKLCYYKNKDSSYLYFETVFPGPPATEKGEQGCILCGWWFSSLCII